MANTLQIRRSSVSLNVPTTAQLALGELAINTKDGKLFFKRDNGVQSIIEASIVGHTHAGVYEPANANIQSHISNTSNPHGVTAAQIGVESGATADQTAAEILAALITVDGAGSGLDADLLDGQNLSSAAGNNTVVQRNASGHIYSNHHNLSRAANNAIATHYMYEQGSDGFILKKTLANVKAEIVTGAAVNTALGYTPEIALGNPTTNGYVLSSTIAGVRSWVAQSGGATTNTISSLRTITIANNEIYYVKAHTTAGDGGGGNFRGVTGAAAGTYVDNNGTIIVPTGGDGSAAWLRANVEKLTPAMFGGNKEDAEKRKPRKIFSKLYSAATAPSAIKYLSLGDSLATLKMQHVLATLDRKIGGSNSGPVNAAGNVASIGQPSSGVDCGTSNLINAVLETGQYQYWMTGKIHRIDAAGSIDYVYRGVNPIFDKIRVYYITEPAAGTINLSVGGVIVATASAAAPIGIAFLEYTQALAQSSVTVSVTGASVRIPFVHKENTTSSGVDWYGSMAVGGLNLVNPTSDAQGLAIIQAAIALISPDFVTFEMDDEFGDNALAKTAYKALESALDAAAPLADKLVIGSTPRAANDAGKIASTYYLKNQVYSNNASWMFFDTYYIMGTYTEMGAIFGADDGTHPNKAAHAYAADLIWDYLGLNSVNLGYVARAVNDGGTPSRLGENTKIGMNGSRDLNILPHESVFAYDWHIGAPLSLSFGDPALGTVMRVSSNTAIRSNVMPNKYDIGTAGSGITLSTETATGQMRHVYSDSNKDATKGNLLVKLLFSPCALTKAVLISGKYPANVLVGTIVRVTDGAAGDGLYLAVGASPNDWQRISFAGAV